MTKKIESKSEQKRKAVQQPKETEFDKAMKNIGEQISGALKKNIKVLKTIKCTKEQLEKFAVLKQMADDLQEAQNLFEKARTSVWTKIEKDLKVKTYFKKDNCISIKFDDQKKSIQVIEDKNPKGILMGGALKI